MSDINDKNVEAPGYFAVIPATVRYDKSLSPNAKLLYGEITALCKKEGYCWASNSYFADLYNVQRSSISNWVKALVDAGHITVEYVLADGKPNIEKRKIFITNIPRVYPKKQAPDSGQEKSNSKEGGQKIDQGGGQIFEQGGQKNRKRIIQANNTKAAAASIEQIPAEIPPEIEKPPEKAAADVFDDDDVEMLKGQFKHLNSKLHFDEAFYPKVLEFLALHKIGFNFVTWIYELCAKKNPRNLSAYLYTVFFEERYVELFREASRPPPEPTISLIRCPACDTEHNELDASCPCCALDKNKRDDFREVFVKKRFLSMSPDEKRAYDNELSALVKNKSQDFKLQRERIQDINRRYGLVPPE